MVHTSIREGWGLNVIEANAMGTPAIVYPVGGLVDSTVDGPIGSACFCLFGKMLALYCEGMASLEGYVLVGCCAL